jgi:hypothetical protein
MNKILVVILALVLGACQPAPETETTEAPEAAPEAETPVMPEPAPETAAAVDEGSDTLAAVLDAQPDEIKARYQYRHPQETLEFFGVKPGMTVVEALPGGGWYTKILLPYLGSEGHLIGANYSLDVSALYSNSTEESMERARAWISNFPADAAEWAGDDGTSRHGAFRFTRRFRDRGHGRCLRSIEAGRYSRRGATSCQRRFVG